ncbi:MAG: DUF4435 domain-containing protein [Mycoplasmataceae bacterium]|jgi:hypothetical protein|nr:DUF4435 domain-containing protein [Mycoplasmataceae bacterium]
MNSNSTLQYSEDALNVKALFYNKKWMVYVEGQDDVLFWDKLFKEVSNSFEIQEVKGYENLIPYMDSIIAGNNNKVVACDKDHSHYIDSNKYINDYIIYTYGYSIENTMYCHSNINNTIKKLARKTNDYSDVIDTWYKNFCNNSLKLLPYDVINYINNKGISCYGDNCCRFLKSEHSELLDENKINDFINKNSLSFTTQEIDEINTKINNDIREDRFKIKGHFLTNGVINFIKNTVTNKNVVLNNNTMYALMVHCIERCNPICEDRKNVVTKIQKAYDILINS